VYFSDEVFSLGMPSVCPHLTTVYATIFRTFRLIKDAKLVVNTYHMCAIISSSFIIFTQFLKIFFVFKEVFFQKILSLCMVDI